MEIYALSSDGTPPAEAEDALGRCDSLSLASEARGVPRQSPEGGTCHILAKLLFPLTPLDGWLPPPTGAACFRPKPPPNVTCRSARPTPSTPRHVALAPPSPNAAQFSNEFAQMRAIRSGGSPGFDRNRVFLKSVCTHQNA